MELSEKLGKRLKETTKATQGQNGGYIFADETRIFTNWLSAEKACKTKNNHKSSKKNVQKKM